MIDLRAYHQYLKAIGVEFVTGVPDTLLNDLCLYFEREWPAARHVIAANEGNAIALAAGYHLATGTVPLVYMQNSGLGNATNPLISLTDSEVYGIPMVLMIGWRGVPGSNDWPQHRRQGELTPVMLDAMRVPYRILSTPEDVDEFTRWAVEDALANQRPAALLVKKGVMALPEKAGFEHEIQHYTVSREEAINCILDAAPKEAIFVASTGRCTRELHALREIRGESHDRDFLNVGAMGHTLSIATGIAAAKTKCPVVCLDGDAAAIMHMGSLAVTAHCGVSNLLHVVLNNGAHESVGGQASVGAHIEFSLTASSLGYDLVYPRAITVDQIHVNTTAWAKAKRKAFMEIRVKKGMRTDLPPLKIYPVTYRTSFMTECVEKNAI